MHKVLQLFSYAYAGVFVYWYAQPRDENSSKLTETSTKTQYNLVVNSGRRSIQIFYLSKSTNTNAIILCYKLKSCSENVTSLKLY